MSKIRSHEGCSHASTKAARAKCRRDRVKWDSMMDAVITEAASTKTLQSQKIELPAPIVLDDATAVKELFDEVESEGALDMTGTHVSRLNWKDVKDYRVEMKIRVDGSEGSSTRVGKITGWGEKKIRFISDEGKLNMIDSERVISATVI